MPSQSRVNTWVRRKFKLFVQIKDKEIKHYLLEIRRRRKKFVLKIKIKMDGCFLNDKI